MATIDIGRVGERGSIGVPDAPAPPADPEARVAFERELLSLRVRAGSPQAGGATPSAKRSLVAPLRTHLSGSEAAASIATAWQNVFHEPPSPETLRVLVAQWAHETGGGRSMMNYNFGGIKGVGPSGLSAAYLTTEGQGETQQKRVDGFRAYGSAIEGATDYVRLLAGRYGAALANAREGDAAGFVTSLKQGGYFTGSVEDYARSVTRLSQQARVSGYDAVGRGQGHGPPGGIPGVVGGNVRTELAAVQQQPPASRVGVGVGVGASRADGAALYAADALAMADELCRAALRIAADDEKRRG